MVTDERGERNSRVSQLELYSVASVEAIAVIFTYEGSISPESKKCSE
jgi:hypothetical protein